MDNYDDQFNLNQYDFFVLMLANDVERTEETDNMDKYFIQLIVEKLKKPIFIAKTSFGILLPDYIYYC